MSVKKKTTIELLNQSEKASLYSAPRHRGYYIRNLDIVMRKKQEWFNEKVAAVSPEVMSEVQLSADIVARIDAVLKQKNMTQRDLAKRMGRSETVVSRWVSGFPNLTLKSIAELSIALGEPLVMVAKEK